MTVSTTPHQIRRTWLLWLAGALAFPIAGLAGTAVAGRVDDAGAALVGGTVAGLSWERARRWRVAVGSTRSAGSQPPGREWVPA